MDYRELLEKIADEYKKILGENLTGIYVHGSIAFGCFNRHKSDIDFLVVTENEPTMQQKKRMLRVLLKLTGEAPPKGFEMSVVLRKYCKNFVYPTPYELHFSNMHMESCRQDLDRYCREMKGTDKDLAAHFTVTKEVGIRLCGQDISTVFGEVPRETFIDSIICDVKGAEEEILDNSVYIILNLCRVLAYLREGLIVSKLQGGLWALKNTDAKYRQVIKTALQCYSIDDSFVMYESLTIEFANYMLKQLFA